MSALGRRARILERFGLFNSADRLREQQKRQYRRTCALIARGFRFALAIKIAKGSAP